MLCDKKEYQKEDYFYSRVYNRYFLVCCPDCKVFKDCVYRFNFKPLDNLNNYLKKIGKK